MTSPDAGVLAALVISVAACLVSVAALVTAIRIRRIYASWTSPAMRVEFDQQMSAEELEKFIDRFRNATVTTAEEAS